MNKLTSIHLTFDKVLITILTPGLVACFPYLMLLFAEYENLKEYFDNANLTALIAFITISALIFGFILENLGGRIEVMIYDPIHSKQSYGKDHKDVWDAFLTLNYKDKEPVGHRYLRDILMRMKFELAFGIGLIFMSVGLLIYNCKHCIIEDNTTAFFTLFFIPFVLSAYLLVVEGYSSSKILCKTRKLLVKNFPHELGKNQIPKDVK
jgi:hypothetical protein